MAGPVINQRGLGQLSSRAGRPKRGPKLSRHDTDEPESQRRGARKASHYLFPVQRRYGRPEADRGLDREALAWCTPLNLTPGLGGAVAGRAFTLRFTPVSR